MVVRKLASVGSAMAVAGILVAGCSGGSTGGGAPLAAGPTTPTTTAPVTEAQTRELLEATTLVNETSTLPLLVAMDELSPGSFPSVGTATSTNTVVSGNSTSGTATFDFSGGQASGGDTVSGTITVDYTGSGGAATIVMSFANFSATTASSTLAIDGSLTYVASYSGSNATVVTSGAITVTLDGVTQTIALNTTMDFDGVAMRTVVAGTSTITHSQLGTWTVTAAGVTSVEDANGDVVVTAGTMTLTRTLPFPATAVYVFTGNSGGTVSITPTGFSGSFQL
jgi:hypothetical protein